MKTYAHLFDLGSVVGIEIRYGLDGPGIEFRWGEIICIHLERPWGSLSLEYSGYLVFPGSKAAWTWR